MGHVWRRGVISGGKPLPPEWICSNCKSSSWNPELPPVDLQMEVHLRTPATDAWNVRKVVRLTCEEIIVNAILES
jgi:hypothetical protein